MGHAELWAVKAERDAIYANPEMSEEDGLRVADLEVQFGEMDGYTAESRAGELLLGVGIPLEQHYGPMSNVAPGWKLRVLLAQALFSDPDVLLLDEPTRALDIGHQQQALELVDSLRREQGLTVVSAMHDLTLAGMYADRLVLMHQGARVAEGTAREVLKPNILSEFYGVSARVHHEEDGTVVVIPQRNSTR